MAQRVRIYKAGSWDQLQIEEFNCPGPEAGEVKIDVKAAGVNFADTIVRQGYYASAKKYVGWPITPGFEVAGKIAAVGKGVNGFKVGDRVMAVTFFNGYSSEVVVNESYVCPIPSGLDFTQAAGIPAVFCTSFYAVQWLGRIHKGSTALVHSAAGGVGLSLVQVLKDAGCKVVGVVGQTNKVAVASEYGADTVIDKSKTDLWPTIEVAEPNGFDLIFEPNGISTLKQSYKHLAQTGLLFVYGHQSMLSKTRGKQNPLLLITRYLRTPRFSPFKMLTDNKSIMAFNVSFLYERQDILKAFFDYTLDKFEAKVFKPLPIKTYDFKDVAKAHQDIQSGKTVGKLILMF